MSTPAQSDLFPPKAAPADPKTSLLRCQLGALGAFLLLALLFFTPAWGVAVSVMTYNSWATLLVLAWAIVSGACWVKALEDGSPQKARWLWAVWVLVLWWSVFAASRAEVSAGQRMLSGHGNPIVVDLIEKSSRADLEKFVDLVNTSRSIPIAAYQVFGMGISPIYNASGFQELYSNAAGLVTTGVESSFTFGPCRKQVAAYLGKDNAATGLVLQVNGKTVSSTNPVPCEFGFNRLTLTKH